MRTAVVTGAAGLVGSAAVRFFGARGWQVVGIDNDERQRFFGPAASTTATRAALSDEVPGYRHHDVDVRHRAALASIFATHERDIALVVHAAAQPSHDWAATAPAVDFDINAVATLALLELTRQHCPEAVFLFVSTNKVYGDTPNRLPLIEQPTRWEVDPAHPYAAHGIDEGMSVDATLHSLFGCSKLAADVLVQEYGRYFGLRTACFRCGCITGGNHAAVAQHGFLAHLMRCAVRGEPYVIHGYGGKQVRDNLHADDLVTAFEAFRRQPRSGAVYNMGGGRHSHCSLREAIALCERATGRPMAVTYVDAPRRGDHVWWISDVRTFQRDYPEWGYRYDLDGVVASVYAGAVAAESPRASG
ncbi:MAG: NAD-dependent epimerase/dehydratase family protein [Candidatus Binatia bacterium]